MECNKDFRHVCFKDLQNYIERDKYFSDFTPEEIKLIKQNLKISENTEQDSDNYNPIVIVNDYNNILELANNNALRLGYIYIINNYRTVYLDKAGNILGLDKVPSEEYYLILTPNSTSTFDKRVSLKVKSGTSSSLQWIVEYDITPTIFSNGTSNRGTITYLKDQNNNYAYYDFKNVKFLQTMDDLISMPSTYTEEQYFYTFDLGGIDGSETTCKNNHLEKGAVRNIFLDTAQNVTLAADCHDNIFQKSCENSTFGYGTYGNTFKTNVINCRGTINGKEVNSITQMDGPKEFILINSTQFIQYFDPETMTIQITQL